MKKIISFASVIMLFSITACRKNVANNGIPLGTISVTIDGQSTNFSFAGKATRSSDQADSVLEIYAFKKDPASSSTNLAIRIMRSGAITAGTYIENTANNPLVQVTYLEDFFFTTTEANSYNSTTNPVVVTITSVNAESVQGTFKGDLQASGSGTATLTNGEFNIAF